MSNRSATAFRGPDEAAEDDHVVTGAGAGTRYGTGQDKKPYKLPAVINRARYVYVEASLVRNLTRG